MTGEPRRWERAEHRIHLLASVTPVKQTRYRIEVHAAEAVSSPLSIVSLGDVGGDGGVTDRATRGARSAGSGIVRCTTSLGLRSSYDSIPSPSRMLQRSNSQMINIPKEEKFLVGLFADK